jgi:hypothetical protein
MHTTRALWKVWLLLFLFVRGCRILRSLSFCKALLVFIHPAGGINEFLRAGIKRVAHVADTNQKGVFGRTCLNDIAARTTNFRFLIFRMYFSFHNKGRKEYQSPRQ